MKVYIASSKKNTYWHGVKHLFEVHGHEVFDWHNHFTYGTGLPDPDGVAVERMQEWVREPQTVQQLAMDNDGIAHAAVFVLLLPCGSDAHYEMGKAAAWHIPTYVLALEGHMRACLFYAEADGIYASAEDLIRDLGRPKQTENPYFQTRAMEDADG